MATRCTKVGASFFCSMMSWLLTARYECSGLLSTQREKSINVYFIMVPLRKKYLKYGTPKPSVAIATTIASALLRSCTFWLAPPGQGLLLVTSFSGRKGGCCLPLRFFSVDATTTATRDYRCYCCCCCCCCCCSSSSSSSSSYYYYYYYLLLLLLLLILLPTITTTTTTTTTYYYYYYYYYYSCCYYYYYYCYCYCHH